MAGRLKTAQWLTLGLSPRGAQIPTALEPQPACSRKRRTPRLPHTREHTRTHAHTHTRTQGHTHTRTHTHTAYSCIPRPPNTEVALCGGYVHRGTCRVCGHNITAAICAAGVQRASAPRQERSIRAATHASCYASASRPDLRERYPATSPGCHAATATNDAQQPWQLVIVAAEIVRDLHRGARLTRRPLPAPLPR